MADSEEGGINGTTNLEQTDSEIMTNGTADDQQDTNLLHPGAVLPRRSSLVKDNSRKQQRKKTVSFSSMPNERMVVNGR